MAVDGCCHFPEAVGHNANVCAKRARHDTEKKWLRTFKYRGTLLLCGNLPVLDPPPPPPVWFGGCGFMIGPGVEVQGLWRAVEARCWVRWRAGEPTGHVHRHGAILTRSPPLAMRSSRHRTGRNVVVGPTALAAELLLPKGGALGVWRGGLPTSMPPPPLEFALVPTGRGPHRKERGKEHPQYANYWAPLTRKRHTMSHSVQPQHTNYWAPRMPRKQKQENRPQRPTESSNPTQHAKGRTGDCPGPRKETTTRRNVTHGENG